MDNQEYVDNMGQKCPNCNGNQIEGGSFDISEIDLSQEVRCLECEV